MDYKSGPEDDVKKTEVTEPEPELVPDSDFDEEDNDEEIVEDVDSPEPPK